LVFTSIANVSVPTVMFADSTAIPGNNYVWYVRYFCWTGWEGAPSNHFAAMIPLPILSPPVLRGMVT
jgi:hypothetical protein